ncbi:MAG: gas vesicle accessory protein GvpU [Qipengyuania sp.]
MEENEIKPETELEHSNVTEAELAHDLARDWLLVDIIDMVNRSEDGMALPITLLISGKIVSGKIISGIEYFDKYGDYWASWVEDEDKARTKQAYGSPGKMYGTSDENKGDASFVHMQDVRFYDGSGQIPKNQGVLWRGKIASVDGFSFGELVIAD